MHAHTQTHARALTYTRIHMRRHVSYSFCTLLFFSVLKAKVPQGPGEMGKPVMIPESQHAEMKEKFKINQFNLMASDLISVNRTLSDVRMEG